MNLGEAMAGKSQNVSVVARAAPGSKKRRIRLCRSPIRISTKDDDDTTCDLFTWTWDSLGEIMALGTDFLVHSDKDSLRWDAFFAVLARIPPVHRTSPGSKTASALEQLRETRMWRQIGYWRSRDRTDAYARDVTEEMDEGAKECSRRLVKKLRDEGYGAFPDEEFVQRMAMLLREEDKSGELLTEPAGFPEFRNEVLRLAALDPKLARRELANAQKSKNADRKRMAKQFMTFMQDEVFRAYCPGMELVLTELEKQGYCKDLYSRGFYLFFHRQHAYLDGLVPDLHPIRALLQRSKQFIDAAVRRFDCDASQGMPSLVQADFFGALEAALFTYRHHILGERTEDKEEKKRRATTYATGSSLENLAYDKGAKGGVRRRKRE